MDDTILKSLSSSYGKNNQQILAYFEYLKTNADGWKTCIDALISENYKSDDQIYFFLLQILEYYLKTSYVGATFEEHNAIKNFLLRWLQNLNSSDETRAFILNKHSQLFCLACLVDFPNRWPSFFRDLLLTLNIGEGHRVVQVYLKIFLAIHEEVVDREIPHSEDELRRNTLIKDMMREQCINQLVSSWYDVLVCYESQHQLPASSSILAECLKVIGEYISWIDLSLVANDNFIQIILRLMGSKSSNQNMAFVVRGGACDCLGEMVVKGMDAGVKVALVQTMASVIHSSGVLAHLEKLDRAEEEEEDDDDEDEYRESLAGLLCNMGCQLVLSWHKFYKAKDLENTKTAFTAMQSKLIPLLKVLAADDNAISAISVLFFNAYISVLKLLPPSEEKKLFVKEILTILHKKMQYPLDYNFNNDDGDDEMEVQELRKDLKVLFINTHSLDPDTFLETVRDLVMNLIDQPISQSQPFPAFEVSIYFLFLLGEVIPLSGQAGKTGVVPENRLSTLYAMLAKLINSNVSHYPHSSVQLQYFESISRFEKFFSTHTQYIHDVLVSFLDERGLWHRQVEVRSRCAYLFSKFVKSINKNHLQPDLEMVLQRLSSLLTLNTNFKAAPPSSTTTPLAIHHPHPTSTTVTSSHSSHKGAGKRGVDGGGCGGEDVTPHLSVEDQQFMFETAGILIIQSQFPPQKKQELMSSLVVPLLNQFEHIFHQLTALSTTTYPTSQFPTTTTPTPSQLAHQQQEMFLTQLLCHAISFVSRASKGFSGQQTLRSNGCVAVFCNAMNVFLPSLRCAPHLQPLVHQAFRQFLHRMVICLEDEITPFIHPCIESLMTNASSKQLTDFIPFLNQLILKFKKQIVPFVQPIFIPIVSTIQNSLATVVDDNDNVTKAEKAMLLRGYYGYLNVVLNNGTQEILTTQDGASVKGVVEGVLGGCMEASDPPSQKTCFLILKKLIEIADVPIDMRALSYERVVPCCFSAPLLPAFDLSDAQTLLTLNEMSSCLFKLHEKYKEEFLLYLSSTYLPSINLNQVVAMQLCENLSTSSEKAFQNTMKIFVSQLKNGR